MSEVKQEKKKQEEPVKMTNTAVSVMKVNGQYVLVTIPFNLQKQVFGQPKITKINDNFDLGICIETGVNELVKVFNEERE